MEEPIIDSVEMEVANLCLGLSQTTTSNDMLTLDIIPKTIAVELVPGMELSTEIPYSEVERSVPKYPLKKEKKFKCSFCDFAFSLSGDLKRHEMTHTGLKQFKCDVCENAFARAATLKIHRMQHSGEKPFPCDVCGAAFALNSRLKRHKMSHTGERPFRCDICGHTFIVSRDLRVHQTTHTERENKNYSCDLCGSEFTHKSTVRAHMRTTHINTTPFKCKICGSAFQASDELKKHKKVHVGEKIFKCQICGNSFARKLTLRRHELTHSGVKNYHCDICKASFSRRNTLIIHQMTHTGDKPFKCSLCKASFALNVRLKRHMMTHSGERPFECDVCGAAFALSNRLKRHKTTHLQKSCENSHQRSKSSYETLKKSTSKKIRTLQAENGNKLFVCQICNNEFPHENDFKKHLSEHTSNGEKTITPDIWRACPVKKLMFSCNFCQFSTQSNLKFKHHQKIHNIETNGRKCHNYNTRLSRKLTNKFSIPIGCVSLQKPPRKQQNIKENITSMKKICPKDLQKELIHNNTEECISRDILTNHQFTQIPNENKNCKDDALVYDDSNNRSPVHDEATPTENTRVHQGGSCKSNYDSEA